MKKTFYWMLIIVLVCSVAPSILHIKGLEPPGEMTGKCLIKE